MATASEIFNDLNPRPGVDQTLYEAKYGYAMLVCKCGRRIVIGVPPVYPFRCDCGRNVE